MAKLTDEVLKEGRAKVTGSDLEGLMEWVRTNAPGVFPEDTLRSMGKTFKMTFLAQDPARGLKLFNKTFADMDPQAEVAGRKLRNGVGCGCALFAGLGLLGGVVYLFRSLFGL